MKRQANASKKTAALKPNHSNDKSAVYQDSAEPNSTKSANGDVGKQVVLSAASQELLDQVEAKEKEKLEILGGWARRLITTRTHMEKLNQTYRKLLYSRLQEAYGVYTEASKHNLGEVFFNNLRFQLKKKDIKVQTNSTDAAIVIRFVCGESVPNKSVHDWSTALIHGQVENVAADKFADWLTTKTLTTVIKERRALAKNDETRAERMRRARIVVLRLIEAREATPIHNFKTTVKNAEGQISKSGLWLGIGNATRRADRESFYADVNICMVLPPNIDTEIFILNQLARGVETNLERYEAEIDKFEQGTFSDDLWEMLVSAGEEEARASWTKSSGK